MRPTTIEELLREIPVADASDARERAVASARAEIEARRVPVTAPRRPRRPRRRALSLALATVLFGVALVSPPGRAATRWVGDLVGIGEVGGPPTKKHRELADDEQAIVINNGVAPDGSRYEWVVYPCSTSGLGGVVPKKFTGFGVSLEWPGNKRDSGGGFCSEGYGWLGPKQGPIFRSHGTEIMPSQFKGAAEPDLVVSGETDRRVYGVRVIYVDAAGRRHPLEVDFQRIEPELRGKVTASRAFGGTFVAFIPGEWAARDEVESRLDLRFLRTTGKLEVGPLTRRDRRRAERALRICAGMPLERYRRCMDRNGPVSPVEYVALDKRGRVLERMEEPLALPAPRGERPPGPRLTKRPRIPGAVGKPVVLVTGRAPGGRRYEWYVERYKDDSRVDGSCTILWWPNQTVPPSSSCGPGLPPAGVFGLRHPKRVFARPFDFLSQDRTATRYVMLSGFARPGATRVAVTYDGRQAPVDLIRVDGALRERVAADRPFGFFVAFVAPRARRGPIEVSAYDSAGRLLSRYEHRPAALD
jgi:hypothetical protein